MNWLNKKTIKKLFFSSVNLLVLFNISIKYTYGTMLFIENETQTKPIEKRVAVVGDSYTGHFVEDEGIDKFEPFIFPVGTINNSKNVEIFNKAIDSDSDYILFATGVNDQALSVLPDAFESTLREHVKRIEQKNKFLFVHTYMDYKTRQSGIKYTPSDYDKILRQIAEESNNVFYIDMSGIDKNKYDMGDGLHYNKFFNDTLRCKLLYIIDKINYNLHNIETDWMKIVKSNQIAVVGDKSANLFYTYEKMKDYDLINFSYYTSLIESMPIINDAVCSTAKYVVLSIGANDYEMQSDPIEFGECLRKLANKSCEAHKMVFFHSYMNYKPETSFKTTISYYDRILREVASEYYNICYLDMHKYEDNTLYLSDEKNYNSVFYDVLYNIVDTFIKGAIN